MLYTAVLAQVLIFTSFVSALPAKAAAADKGPDVAETDVGSILKSMNQAQLVSIPADSRAVMKKMPEEPKTVTAADRAAITSCMTNANVTVFGKEAVSLICHTRYMKQKIDFHQCAAQKDQISAVIDKKKNVPTTNMAKFVKDAKAQGAVIPAAEKKAA